MKISVHYKQTARDLSDHLLDVDTPEFTIKADGRTGGWLVEIPEPVVDLRPPGFFNDVVACHVGCKVMR